MYTGTVNFRGFYDLENNKGGTETMKIIDTILRISVIGVLGTLLGFLLVQTIINTMLINELQKPVSDTIIVNDTIMVEIPTIDSVYTPTEYKPLEPPQTYHNYRCTDSGMYFTQKSWSTGKTLRTFGPVPEYQSIPKGTFMKKAIKQLLEEDFDRKYNNGYPKSRIELEEMRRTRRTYNAVYALLDENGPK